ncbi:type II secretion system F family protein [Paenibacillus timonensis]|uniref:Type II secretion system F family protein n=1 Tax=Paenibacillus timonensis TaxID=225915 RepID=A0ABW3SBJ9_9BACL|nr:type II secretion system F family protein [Paenibacillus timonensis]MCH1640290.1 type II secretion system F family protein [Paenibacillus timonensis]
MPQYVYQGKDGVGKQRKGALQAPDRSTALAELKRQQIVVTGLREKRETVWNKEFYLGNPVKNEQFVVFCRQFATMIKAGISIVEATAILAEQSESKALKKTLAEVAAELRKGSTFSGAISAYPRIFPTIFVQMIRAGEEAGSMEETLERLAVYFEKAHVTREKVKSAMTYPLIVSVMAVFVIIFLLKFMIPRFQTMFAQLGGDLPAITKFTLSLSRSLEQHWIVWLLIALAAVAAVYLLLRWERGAYAWDYIKLKAPVFGILNRKSAIAQLTRTLSSLFASAVPVLQALAIVEKAVGNRVIGATLRECQASLRQGRPLSEPLRQSWVFPPLVTQMIRVGEETGSIDAMLAKVADFYERDVENTVDKLKQLIEPVMILLLAGVVGFIVASVMIPMLSLYRNIS